MKGINKLVPRTEKVAFIDIDKRCPLSRLTLLKVKQFFILNNYSVCRNSLNADILVINTCASSDPIMRRSESFIENLLTTHVGKRIVILGCLTALTDRFSRAPGVISIPQDDTERLADHFEHHFPVRDIQRMVPPDFADSSVGHVLISHGCVHSCTYCNVRLIKGPVHSRPISDITNEFKELLRYGHRRLVLLADDVGGYGYDLNTNIVALTSELLELDTTVQIMFFNFFPGLFLKYFGDLKRFIADRRIYGVCLPVQSGSPRILALMKRSYDLDRIREALEEIRRCNPDVVLTTHFIFDFPTETMEDFEKSVELAAWFDNSLFFQYVDNEKTPAYRLEPKCSREESQKKVQRINLSIKNGRVAETVPEPLREGLFRN